MLLVDESIRAGKYAKLLSMTCKVEMVALSKSIFGTEEGTNISVKMVRKLLLMSGNPMIMSIPGIVCTTRDMLDLINSPLLTLH